MEDMSIHFDPVGLVKFFVVMGSIFGHVGAVGGGEVVRVHHPGLVRDLELLLSRELVFGLFDVLDISDLFEFLPTDFPVVRLLEVLGGHEAWEFRERTCHFSCIK